MTTIKVYLQSGSVLTFTNVFDIVTSATAITFSYPDDVSTSAVKGAMFGLYGIAGYEIVTR